MRRDILKQEGARMTKKQISQFSDEEYSQDMTNQNLNNWLLLYHENMPLAFPFIISHCRWEKDEYYIHHCPTNTAIEIVLEGSMKYTLEDETRIVRADEMILLPVGVPNRITAGPDGFSRKAVFGIRGFLSQIILAAYRLESGKVYHLKDTGRILQMLSQLVVLHKKQDPKLLNRASAAAFEILLEIKDQIHSRQSQSLGAIQLMQLNIRKQCSIPEFARRLNLSREKLNAIFRGQFQQSPQQYKTRLRMQIAEQLLCQTDQPIKQIALQTGYHSLSRFAAAFRRHHGVSPRGYRKAGRNPRTGSPPELPSVDGDFPVKK